MSALLPLPVAIPLLCAAVVVAGDHVTPRTVRDVIAIAGALATCAISAYLFVRTGHGDVLHWFGGWHPRHGVALGIDFVADPLGAAMATFSSALVVLTLIFSRTYLSEASVFYDALLLIFCAGMCGFALTGDLFNMFVWFEVMGVAAYALAGFDVERLGPAQGAFNFAISNTVGAYLLLLGIGIAYARTGALNLAQLGVGLAHHPPGLLVAAALTLVLVGFLVKAAVVPFHFWLADAHAVAPAPVCVLFSGAMVELGLFAVARVYWTVFRVPVAHHHLIPDVLLWLGLATALVGAAMSFLQRHLKRMLAYSTISHAGIMLAGVALLGTKGLAGAANMVLSHGLLKGALFLIGGILLSMFGEVDELRLHGRGRALPGVGVLFGIAAVGLIGVPYVGTFLGHDLIDQSAAANGSPWVGPIVMVAAGISAGAILRAGARIFLGWGGTDDSFLSPEPPEQVEGEDASMPVMVAVIAVMVALGTVASVIPGLEKRSEHAAERFRDHGAYVDRVLHGVPVPAGHELPFHVPLPPAESFAYAVGAALVALATAALGLWWRRLGRRMWYLRPVLAPAAHGLRAVHSGLIGDYVTWLTVGAAAIGVVFALELR